MKYILMIQFFGGSGSKSGLSGGSSGGNEQPSGRNSSRFGTFVYEYRDGSVEYSKVGNYKGSNFSQEESREIRAMSSTVEKDVREQLGVRRNDVDIDLNTMTATVYRDANRYERNRGAIGAKDFYNIEVSFKTVTYDRRKAPEGDIKQTVYLEKVRVRKTGSKI